MKRVFMVKPHNTVSKEIGAAPVFTVVCDREEDIIPQILHALPATDGAARGLRVLLERGAFFHTEIPLDQNGVY